MRGLIVDDNFEFAEMLTMAFKPYMAVDHALNGTEGVKAFCNALRADEPYQVIFLDLQMPMRDGVETIKYIRMIEQKLMLQGCLGARIVVVTGFPDHVLALQAYKAGCQAIIPKTEGVSAIIEKVREFGLLEEAIPAAY